MKRIQDIYCTGIEAEYHPGGVAKDWSTRMTISNIHTKKRYKPLPVHMIHSQGVFIETIFGLGGCVNYVSCIAQDRILRLRLSPGKHENCYTLREILMENAPAAERPRKEKRT